jgi:hypothetical protein
MRWTQYHISDKEIGYQTAPEPTFLGLQPAQSALRSLHHVECPRHEKQAYCIVIRSLGAQDIHSDEIKRVVFEILTAVVAESSVFCI